VSPNRAYPLILSEDGKYKKTHMDLLKIAILERKGMKFGNVRKLP
jgi:hypothetical protein